MAADEMNGEVYVIETGREQTMMRLEGKGEVGKEKENQKE